MLLFLSLFLLPSSSLGVQFHPSVSVRFFEPDSASSSKILDVVGKDDKDASWNLPNDELNRIRRRVRNLERIEDFKMSTLRFIRSLRLSRHSLPCINVRASSPEASSRSPIPFSRSSSSMAEVEEKEGDGQEEKLVRTSSKGNAYLEMLVASLGDFEGVSVVLNVNPAVRYFHFSAPITSSIQDFEEVDYVEGGGKSKLVLLQHQKRELERAKEAFFVEKEKVEKRWETWSLRRGKSTKEEKKKIEKASKNGSETKEGSEELQEKEETNPNVNFDFSKISFSPVLPEYRAPPSDEGEGKRISRRRSFCLFCVKY